MTADDATNPTDATGTTGTTGTTDDPTGPTTGPTTGDATTESAAADDAAPAADDGSTDDERWLVVHGRRWRRTDPSLPTDVVEALTSHLGRGRSGVRVAKKAGDDDQVAAARRRVGLAKAGLGERGPRWWDEPEADRSARAREALRDLDALDALDAPGPAAESDPPG